MIGRKKEKRKKEICQRKRLVLFGSALWHINHCKSFNTKSTLYIKQFYFKQFSLA